jgi:ribosomal protein S18 acetylase RimI-like enzyme
MLTRDLDAVVAIETASFTQPYARHVFETFISKCSDGAACCWSIVAVSSAGDVCGYCMSDAASCSSVRVISLGTAAMYRGQGVGSLLLKHCISCARLHRASSLTLHVAIDNVAAMALYTRLGFVAVHKLAAYYREVSGDVDAWEMEFRLS